MREQKYQTPLRIQTGQGYMDALVGTSANEHMHARTHPNTCTYMHKICHCMCSWREAL